MPAFTLPSKPAIVAAIENQTVGVVSDRIRAGLLGAGYVLGPGSIAINGDGSVVVDVDRDPSADWANFDPGAETESETTARTQREQVKARYAALKAGTATPAQVQQVLAYLLRQEFADLAP